MGVGGYGISPYFIINADFTFTGVDLDVIKVLETKFQFNVTVIPFFDVRFGIYDNIQNGGIHFGISNQLMTFNDFQKVDYMFHYNMYMRYKSAKPKRLPSSVNIIKPFTDKVYLLAFAVLMVVAILATAYSILVYKSKSFEEVFLDVLSILMIQFTQGITHMSCNI